MAKTKLNQLPKYEHLPDLPENELCSIIDDLLPLYVETLASPASSRLIENHLSSCPACQKKLQALQEPEPQIPAQDLPMKNALEATRKIIRKSRLFILLLSLGCLLLAAAGGWAIFSRAKLSADQLRIRSIQKTEDQTILDLETLSAKEGLFRYTANAEGAGLYSLFVLGGSGFLNRSRSMEVTLQDPVEQVEIEGAILYQDGEIITTMCRHFYPYANGYAGDIQQMQLARPTFVNPHKEILPMTMQADTENESSCTWTMVLSKDPISAIDSSQMEAWKKQCLLVLALTPNLQSIQIRSGADCKTAADRQALETLLSENHLNGQIETIADLQRILNLLFPAG